MGKSKDLATGETRFVNAAGDTMTGNLGINETSPSGSLHVKGTSSTHGKIILEAGGSGGSANNNFMEFNKHDGTKLGELEVGESVTNGGSLVFKTTPSGGSATTRMTINHDGIVTKPSHPSFSAYINGSNPSITSDNTKIPYNAVQWDIGNNFDETNHRYIAPVAGVYHFTVNHNVFSIANDYFFRTKIYVNAAMTSVLGYTRAYNGGDHTVNDSILINLGAADTVEVYTSSNDTSYGLSAGVGWNTFSGFLVG